MHDPRRHDEGHWSAIADWGASILLSQITVNSMRPPIMPPISEPTPECLPMPPMVAPTAPWKEMPGMAPN